MKPRKLKIPWRRKIDTTYLKDGARLTECRLCGQYLMMSAGKSDVGAHATEFALDHMHVLDDAKVLRPGGSHV